MDGMYEFWRRYALGGPVQGGGVNYAPHPPGQMPLPAPAIPHFSPFGGAPATAPTPAGPAAYSGIANAQTFAAPGGIPAGFQNQLQAQVPTSNMQFSQGLYNGTVQSSQDSLNSLAQMLQQRAAGGGPPSVAQQQLRQTTDNNIAQAYAMAAANPNNGASARDAANAAASANQTAAGQAAILRSQEQLAAQQQLGQLGLGQLGTAGRLLTDNDKMALEQAQGNQNAALHAQDTNAQTSYYNQQAANGLLNTGINAAAGTVGGLSAAIPSWVNAFRNNGGAQTTADGASGANPAAAGSSTGAQATGDGTDVGTTDTGSGAGAGDAGGGGDTAYVAHGGLIRALHYAAGGPVPTYDYTGASQVADPRQANLLGNGVSAPFAAAVARGGGTAGAPGVDPGIQAGNGIYDSVAGMIPVVGPAMVALRKWGEAKQQEAAKSGQTYNGLFDMIGGHTESAADEGRDDGMGGLTKTSIFGWQPFLQRSAQGGPVPGQAAVKGDSYRNDTVPAMLSPGEVVLPRSVTQSAHPDERAREFVRALHLACGGMVPRYAEGGPVADSYAAMADQAQQAGGVVAGVPGQPSVGDVLARPAGPTQAPAYGAALARFQPNGEPPPAPVPETAPTPTAPTPPAGPSSGPAGMVAKVAMSSKGPGAGGGGVPSAGTGAYDKAITDEKAAISAKAEVAAHAAEEKARVQVDAVKAQDDAMADIRAHQLERQKAEDAQLQKLQTLNDNIAKASTAVDPNRWWGSRTTGEKISAGIGIILGGIASGILGRPNEALATINSSIADDIEAQKHNAAMGLEKAKTLAANQLNFYSMARQHGLDDDAAEKWAYAQGWDMTAKKLEAASQKYEAPAVRAGAQQLAAEASQKAAQYKSQLGLNLQHAADEHLKAQAEVAKVGVELAQAGQKAAGNPDAYVPGLGYATNKETAGELIKKRDTYGTLNRLIDEAKQLRTQYGSEDIGPAAARMKQISAEIKKAVIKDEGLSNRVGDAEMKMLDDITGGDVSKWGYVLPQLQSLQKHAAADFMDAANNRLVSRDGGGAAYRERKPGG